MQRGRHDAIINKPPIIISTATYGRSPVGRKIKNTFVSDLFFSSTYSSFHTNDVFILEGFQSNQITIASPLIRHNRTLAGGDREEKAGRTHFVIFSKKWITPSH